MGELTSNEPPNFEGMDPSQIEKILIEELMAKPENSEKEAFNFTKTVKPILDSFKRQLLADKKKMQKQLNDDIAEIKTCITKMQKSTRLGLLEDSEGKGKPSNERKKSEPKKKPKCPTKAAVKKCKNKIKDLKPKQKVLKKDCKMDKGETKYHYVKRLYFHFEKKIEEF